MPRNLNLIESSDGCVTIPLDEGDYASALIAMLDFQMTLANRALEETRTVPAEVQDVIRSLPEPVLQLLFYAINPGYRALWREIGRGRD